MVDNRLGVEKKNADERRLVDAVKKGDVGDGRKGMGVASLLQRGLNVNCADGSGCTPLHYACSNGRLEVVKVLMQQKEINVNVQDYYGHTPLHWACMGGHAEVVQHLLTDRNLDISLQTNLGKTALDLAKQSTSGNHARIVAILGSLSSSSKR
eukprot:TRINITY_DN68179_c1_g1_i1.p1 TRINITY_DN68179_c1_g1~~TRINITY_DN68179_c1_g1_i1.p1  ORF type:complete len:160 (+),score=12.97 TRINITY_DN68179_c1_g1_i1:22-480(+)